MLNPILATDDPFLAAEVFVKAGFSRDGTGSPAISRPADQRLDCPDAAERVVQCSVRHRAIATTGANPVPFTLPAGFRPAATVFVLVGLCNATNGRLQIEPTGVVTFQAEGGAFSNAACFTWLDGVSFAPLQVRCSAAAPRVSWPDLREFQIGRAHEGEAQ